MPRFRVPIELDFGDALNDAQARLDHLTGTMQRLTQAGVLIPQGIRDYIGKVGQLTEQIPGLFTNRFRNVLDNRELFTNFANNMGVALNDTIQDANGHIRSMRDVIAGSMKSGFEQGFESFNQTQGDFNQKIAAFRAAFQNAVSGTMQNELRGATVRDSAGNERQLQPILNNINTTATNTAQTVSDNASGGIFSFGLRNIERITRHFGALAGFGQTAIGFLSGPIGSIVSATVFTGVKTAIKMGWDEYNRLMDAHSKKQEALSLHLLGLQTTISENESQVRMNYLKSETALREKQLEQQRAISADAMKMNEAELKVQREIQKIELERLKAQQEADVIKQRVTSANNIVQKNLEYTQHRGEVKDNSTYIRTRTGQFLGQDRAFSEEGDQVSEEVMAYVDDADTYEGEMRDFKSAMAAIKRARTAGHTNFTNYVKEQVEQYQQLIDLLTNDNVTELSADLKNRIAKIQYEQTNSLSNISEEQFENERNYLELMNMGLEEALLSKRIQRDHLGRYYGIDQNGNQLAMGETYSELERKFKKLQEDNKNNNGLSVRVNNEQKRRDELNKETELLANEVQYYQKINNLIQERTRLEQEQIKSLLDSMRSMTNTRTENRMSNWDQSNVERALGNQDFFIESAQQAELASITDGEEKRKKEDEFKRDNAKRSAEHKLRLDYDRKKHDLDVRKVTEIYDLKKKNELELFRVQQANVVRAAQAAAEVTKIQGERARRLIKLDTEMMIADSERYGKSQREIEFIKAQKRVDEKYNKMIDDIEEKYQRDKAAKLNAKAEADAKTNLARELTHKQQLLNLESLQQNDRFKKELDLMKKQHQLRLAEIEVEERHRQRVKEKIEAEKKAGLSVWEESITDKEAQQRYGKKVTDLTDEEKEKLAFELKENFENSNKDVREYNKTHGIEGEDWNAQSDAAQKHYDELKAPLSNAFLDEIKQGILPNQNEQNLPIIKLLEKMTTDRGSGDIGRGVKIDKLNDYWVGFLKYNKDEIIQKADTQYGEKYEATAQEHFINALKASIKPEDRDKYTDESLLQLYNFMKDAFDDFGGKVKRGTGTVDFRNIVIDKILSSNPAIVDQINEALHTKNNGQYAGYVYNPDSGQIELGPDLKKQLDELGQLLPALKTISENTVSQSDYEARRETEKTAIEDDFNRAEEEDRKILSPDEKNLEDAYAQRAAQDIAEKREIANKQYEQGVENITAETGQKTADIELETDLSEAEKKRKNAVEYGKRDKDGNIIEGGRAQEMSALQEANRIMEGQERLNAAITETLTQANIERANINTEYFATLNSASSGTDILRASIKQQQDLWYNEQSKALDIKYAKLEEELRQSGNFSPENEALLKSQRETEKANLDNNKKMADALTSRVMGANVGQKSGVKETWERIQSSVFGRIQDPMVNAVNAHNKSLIDFFTLRILPCLQASNNFLCAMAGKQGMTANDLTIGYNQFYNNNGGLADGNM